MDLAVDLGHGWMHQVEPEVEAEEDVELEVDERKRLMKQEQEVEGAEVGDDDVDDCWICRSCSASLRMDSP